MKKQAPIKKATKKPKKKAISKMTKATKKTKAIKKTKTVDHLCKVCGEIIHPKRVELGYKETCVKHSTAERFTAAISTVNMEGDTEISIIRDPRVAERLEQLDYIYKR